MMSHVDLPATYIRTQVCAAIDVIVHLARLRGGRRVVWEIAAVEGTHRGEPVVVPLFRFRPRAEETEAFEASGAELEVISTSADRGESIGSLRDRIRSVIRRARPWRAG